MSNPNEEYATGMALIKAERERQITAEGWTAEHDDGHGGGGMFDAAMCYVSAKEGDSMSNLWPWERQWWKPKDHLSNLVRAGALLLAEKERIGRRTLGTGGPWPMPPILPLALDGLALAVGREAHGEEEGTAS